MLTDITGSDKNFVLKSVDVTAAIKCNNTASEYGYTEFWLTSTFSTTCLPNEQTLVEHWITISAVLSNLYAHKHKQNLYNNKKAQIPYTQHQQAPSEYEDN